MSNKNLIRSADFKEFWPPLLVLIGSTSVPSFNLIKVNMKKLERMVPIQPCHQFTKRKRNFGQDSQAKTILLKLFYPESIDL